MTELLYRGRRAERLSIEEWNPYACESEKNALDWGGRQFTRHRIKQRRKIRSADFYSRAVSRSALLHAERCSQDRSNNVSEEEFNLLADLWERETRNISSAKVIVHHRAVSKIIDMGEAVVPLILRRMEHHPWFWFSPLLRITKEKNNPVKPSMYGNMQRMTEAWIKWGVRRGLI